MRPGSYDLDEVTVLVEEYEELKGGRSRAFVNVRLMDLDVALKRLPLKQRQAVLLHGQIGLSTRSAGKLLGVNHETLRRRYLLGLESLLTLMNGG